MYKKYKFSTYIFLAALREYREKNPFSIHKFNLYIVYSLMVMMVSFTALYLGINEHIIATVLLLLLVLLSFQSVDFDNFISFCQNKNNKILMAYPMNYSYILLVNILKYLLLHLFIFNLGVLPFAIIFYYFLDNAYLFIFKFYLLVNILCSFAYVLGWTRWIQKWQEVKLAEKKLGKVISIILLGSLSIFIIHLVRTYKLNPNELMSLVMQINRIELSFYEESVYWIVVLVAILLSLLILVYVKTHLTRIYNFYILEGKYNSENTRVNIIESSMNSQRWLNIYLKKEFYMIIRNKNIYNEIVRKIKYSILLMTIGSAYLFFFPIQIDIHIVAIFTSLGVMGYADKIIRSYLPVSAEGKMIINYIQSNTNIKTIIQNKVNMLFLYRQLYIIGPIIFFVSISKFNVMDILYFLIVWLTMSYTSGNIKIYSVSINSKFLTTEDFFKKMTVSGIMKYIIFESSYYYLMFLIVVLCNLYIPSVFAIIVGIVWVSIIYNLAVYILQGHGRKFYGEFERYI